MKQEFGGIWVGEKDLSRDEEFVAAAQSEIQNSSLVETLSENEEAVEDFGGNRRDFLKMMGFGIGAATIAAGCDAPVRRAIPYVVKPEEIVPGVATYYASTYVSGGDACPVVVKTREGRPIKIEGNKLCPVTKGGTSARVQASVLSLYDVNRFRSPKIDGKDASWSEVDAKVGEMLASAKGTRIVTHTMLSPTAKKAVNALVAKYPNVKVVTYDPVSSAALLEANEANFGDRVIPSYHFDKAELIVSVNADFLGTWISPVEFAKQYAKNRVVKDVHGAKISKHVQIESQMSMTGSNADNRILVKPSQQGQAVAYLYGKVTGNAASVSLDAETKSVLDKLAVQLAANAGKSLVVCGNNNVGEQMLVNAINNALGNYGKTLSFDNASLQRQGDERELATLVAEIKNGSVDTVIYHDCNPVFEYSFMNGLGETLSSVKNGIALSYSNNETVTNCAVVAPKSHYLESWGDVEMKRGQVSLIQPTIHPLFDTREAELSLLTWAGAAYDSADQPYYEYLKQSWKSDNFGKQSNYLTFSTFWDNALQDGVVSFDSPSSATGFSLDAGMALSKLSKPASTDLEIQFTQPITIGNGEHANNPWLQEMPDPVTRCTWGNYLAVPVGFDGIKKFKGLNGLKDGDLATLTVGGQSYTLPVIQQFGQAKGTVSLALGYGREVIGGAGRNVGVDINPSIGFKDGRATYFASDVSLTGKKGKEEHYSSVQYHHTMGVTADHKKTGEKFNADEAALAPGYGNIFSGYQGSLVGRSIIRNSHIDNLEHSVEELKHERAHHEGLNQNTLYPYDEHKALKYDVGHHWGMHVDLNACTGCGACTVACMAENNVPVVGKKQVSRHQEMAWLRIDRYYYGDVNNPNVVYQPMMCQHCDNAPCENVCPVNATNHSSEGLNQMTYNRCIGTRYCANNCPYKVRRFNWLDYTTADLWPANQVKVNDEELPFGADNLTRMVLNPDVTVRTRGVIEKCSFCVQKIQEGKLTAKSEGRPLQEEDVTTACATACPTGAITFGDTNMSGTTLSEKLESPLNMIVLEEINVRSSVTYTMKVNNRDESLEV